MSNELDPDISDADLARHFIGRCDFLSYRLNQLSNAMAKMTRLERQLATSGDTRNRALALEILEHINQAELPSGVPYREYREAARAAKAERIRDAARATDSREGT